MAFPLSAGKIVSSEMFLRFLSAALSVLVKLSLGLEALLMILIVSSLTSSAHSTGSDCTAFSTPVNKSSMRMLLGVTA